MNKEQAQAVWDAINRAIDRTFHNSRMRQQLRRNIRREFVAFEPLDKSGHDAWFRDHDGNWNFNSCECEIGRDHDELGKEVTSKCPYKDCWKVHYAECPIHADIEDEKEESL